MSPLSGNFGGCAQSKSLGAMLVKTQQIGEQMKGLRCDYLCCRKRDYTNRCITSCDSYLLLLDFSGPSQGGFPVLGTPCHILPAVPNCGAAPGNLAISVGKNRDEELQLFLLFKRNNILSDHYCISFF